MAENGLAENGPSPAASKIFSLQEVKGHATEDDCWIIVHGKVYDVTKFLDEHPGGFDIILSNTGKDATEDFEEIGHSNAAKHMLDKYHIGGYEGGDVTEINRSAISAVKAKQASMGSSPLLKLLQVLLPLLIILAAIFLPKYVL